MRLAVVAVVLAASFAACGGDGDGAPPPAASHPPPPVEAGTDASQPNALCPNGVPVARPPGPYGMALRASIDPDLSFDGSDGPVRMLDFFEPCADKSRLVVVRVGAAWCGPCVWNITHTNRLFQSFGARLVLLDVLVADEDNMPATPPAGARWKARIDAPGKVVVDPKFSFKGAVLVPNPPLPHLVLVDTRTLTIKNAQTASSPEDIHDTIAIELADLDGVKWPDRTQPALVDSLFTEDQFDLIKGMRLVPTPPADPTNEYGDVQTAADFGKALFADTTLSPQGKSCSSCHDSGQEFQDGVPQSVGGVAVVDRNSPDVALSSHARWQFWDGRADTLWAQALGPPENAKEIGSSRLFIAHRIKAAYATTYDAVFGAKYPLPANLDALPAEGKPGDAAYDAMSAADKDAVTRVYVNVGKAIAAFERSIRVQTTRIDDYADGKTNALSPTEKTALHHFMVAGCPQCHWGPRLTDDAFHAVRFPTGRQDGQPDKGRIDVLPTLAAAEFVASSKWSDAPAAAKPLLFPDPPPPTMLGAFKTPSLRGVARTAPYGHGGTLVTLADVVAHYGTRAKNVGANGAVGEIEPWIPMFDPVVQVELPSFLASLTAEPIP